jgi:hypothetical protein
MITFIIKIQHFKAVALFSLLFISTMAFTQSKDVVLVFRHCEYDLESYSNRYFSILNKDSFSLSYERLQEGTYQFHINAYGPYTLQYPNIFGQNIQKSLTIDGLTNTIAVCVDEFVDTKKTTFIGALKATDKLEIQYYWPCCDINEKATFYIKDSVHYGELFKGKKKRKTKKLTNEQVQFLIDFEKKLNHIQNGQHNCEIKECYSLYFNGNLELRHFDETCDWSGFAKLKKIIFAIEDNK